MKTLQNFIFLSLILTLSSCSELKKQVASDKIIGTFSGKVTYAYKHSGQNIGLNDEVKEVKTTNFIFKNDIDELFVKTGDGNIQLSGITLAANGVCFNISQQSIVSKANKISNVYGVQASELEGIKYDGIYNSDDNTLSFNYQTTIKYNYYGTTADVVVYCIYNLVKVN